MGMGKGMVKELAPLQLVGRKHFYTGMVMVELAITSG
jgi:hypothetical protein